MTAFPHEYAVTASASPVDYVEVRAEGLSALRSAPPREFGGPGASEESARRALEKAERSCLITNSLKAASTLSITIETAEHPQLA